MTQEQLDTAIEAALALGHPLRFRIMRACACNPESPVTLARMFENDVGRVAYHFRVLAARGLLEISERRRVRGAQQKFYVATTDGRAALEDTYE